MREEITVFRSDGCSGNMSWAWARVAAGRNTILPRRKPWPALLPWNDDCVEHDLTYHQGGTRLQRFAADARLMVGVAERGYPKTGMLMFAGVQLGGYGWRAEIGYRLMRLVNRKAMRWNWGYGWGPEYRYEMALNMDIGGME